MLQIFENNPVVLFIDREGQNKMLVDVDPLPVLERSSQVLVTALGSGRFLPVSS